MTRKQIAFRVEVIEYGLHEMERFESTFAELDGRSDCQVKQVFVNNGYAFEIEYPRIIIDLD